MDKKKKLTIIGALLAVLLLVAGALVLLLSVVFVTSGGPPIDMAQLPENTTHLSRTKIAAVAINHAVDHERLDETVRWADHGQRLCGGKLGLRHLVALDLVSDSKRTRREAEIDLIARVADLDNTGALKCGKAVSKELSGEDEWFVEFEAGSERRSVTLWPLGGAALNVVKQAREDEFTELDPHKNTKELVCVGSYKKKKRRCDGRVLATLKDADVIVSGDEADVEAFLDEMSPDGANESEELERLTRLSEKGEGAHQLLLMTPKRAPKWLGIVLRDTFEFHTDEGANEDFYDVTLEANAYLMATRSFEAGAVKRIDLTFATDSEESARDLVKGIERLFKATMRAEREADREERQSSAHPKLVKHRKANAKAWKEAFRRQKVERSGDLVQVSFEAAPNDSQRKVMDLWLKVNHGRLAAGQKILRGLAEAGGAGLKRADFAALSQGSFLPKVVAKLLDHQRSTKRSAMLVFSDDGGYLLQPKGEWVESKPDKKTWAIISYERDDYRKKKQLLRDMVKLGKASGWKAKVKKGRLTLRRKINKKKAWFKVKLGKGKKKRLKATYRSWDQ